MLEAQLVFEAGRAPDIACRFRRRVQKREDALRRGQTLLQRVVDSNQGAHRLRQPDHRGQEQEETVWTQLTIEDEPPAEPQNRHHAQDGEHL